VLALAACAGSPTAAAKHSPTPSQVPFPSPSPSPQYTLEPPSPTPTPPPSLADTLNCRLPISAGSAGSGGFIAFPGGKFVADSASNVVISGVPTPSPVPYGFGYGNFFGLSYDKRYSKWLPVPRQNISPDETHYVYPSPDSVYVVSVADGSKVELGVGTHPWFVLDVEAEGVYANPQQTTSQAIAGLWLLPFSGAPRQITTKGYWQAVGGGAAYGFDAPQVPTGAVQALLRLDLKTAKTSTWVDNLPQGSNVQGFDLTGSPIVSEQTAPNQIVVLTGVNQQVTIYDGSLPNFFLQWGVFADSHGIWMSSGNGLYLSISARASIEPVSQISGPIAGPCA
jgi:hypothetical protein